MGHVQDRWYRKVVDPATKKVGREKTSVHGKGDRYKVRYTDHSGRERSKTFPDRQKKQADDFLNEVENELRRGTYIDPAAGKITFKEYAIRWLRSQAFEESTPEATGLRLRLHVFPYLGARNLDAIRPTDVRELLRALTPASRTRPQVLPTPPPGSLAQAVSWRRVDGVKSGEAIAQRS